MNHVDRIKYHLRVVFTDKPKMEKGFAEKLVAQIINNIQIKINDVHIRYEDRYTINTPFAFGITLSKLSVHTTNENWIEEIVQASVTKIFKVFYAV